MSDIFDEIFNIPEGLVLTERQRKGLDRLDMVNRLSMIKRYKAQQGLDDRNAYKVVDNDFSTTKNDGYYSANKTEPVRLDFDGKYLRMIENGETTLKLKAQSGRDAYQSKKYQHMKREGPLPEGKYYVRQNQVQDIENTWIERHKFGGKAPGGYDSWGHKRVWLEPFSSNQMYGRDKLTIHGGKEYGSAGCVDLGPNDLEFFDKFQKHGRDLILNVHYDENW